MLKNTLSVILLRKKTISTLLLMVTLLGYISYVTFPKEERPEVDLKTVAVVISYQGLSSDDIEKLIAEPLERELMSLDDIDDVISVSKDNLVQFMVRFNLDTKEESLGKIVRNKVNDSKSKLPDDIEIIEIKEYNSSMFSQIKVALFGDVPYKVLNATAEKFKEQFEAIGNVIEVDINGGKEEIIKITVIPELLEKYKINIDEIIKSLRSYNSLAPVGVLSDENAKFSVKIPGLYENYEELKALPIRSTSNFILRLDDIATIERTFLKRKEFVKVNGQEAISISITRKSGTNILDSYASVKEILKENEGKFHPAIQALVVDDESAGIETNISAAENTVITAIILVMIIVIGILGIRSGILIGLAIPVTYLFSILILDSLGMTYNIMTIFGLILAVGMLVDGPIVISEYARSEQEKGVRRRDSYINASYNMFWPIIASALTTIAAFMPLVFWPDTIGQWLRVIPITVIVVLSTSLVVTLIFVPALGSMIERKTDQIEKKNDAKVGYWINRYEIVLMKAIQSPIKVGLATISTFIFVMIMYGQFNNGVQFFPSDKADGARISLTARGNLTVDEKTKYINEVLEIIDQNPHIENYVANTVQRKRIWIFDSNPADIIAKVWMEFKDPEKIPDPNLIIKELQKDLSKIVGFGVEVKGNSYSSVLNDGKLIEIEVTSANKRLLNETAEIIKAKLGSFSEIINPEIKYPISGLEWKYEVDRKQTGKYRIPIQSIGAIINLATDGLKIGTLRPSDVDELDIKVYLPDNQRTLENVEGIKINTSKGSLPISEFVTRKSTDKIFSISRKNGTRNLIIDADLKSGTDTAKIFTLLQQWKTTAGLPLEVDVKFIGEAEDSKNSMSFVIGALVFAILTMFIILICLFNNFYHTFIILFSLVLSTTGIFVGLMILQDSFSIVMTGLGIVACAGIVVNNNIILIDSYRKIRKYESDKHKAILLSTKSRIRPILLTTITTVIGILPSALQLSVNIFDRTISYKSSETYFTEPLAWALVWGLSFAAAATLLVTPALLALPDALKKIINSKRTSQIIAN
jgi:multidrug efflux pump|tara:strand:+ start:9545 stop:12667 length:3123 start_codon:yes stop_codon:yes gene_type:complete